jgi:death-on-curing protein
MRYLSLGEVVDLHQALLDQAGGAGGIRDMAGLESALAQPRATFDGVDLHPTTVQKAAALGFSVQRPNVRPLKVRHSASTPRGLWPLVPGL